MSAPGVMFEGGSEGKEWEKERKKRGRAGGRGGGMKAGTEGERKSSGKYCEHVSHRKNLPLHNKNGGTDSKSTGFGSSVG